MGAWLVRTLGDYSELPPEVRLGMLTREHAEAGFATQRREQTRAWAQELALLDDVAHDLIAQDASARRWTLLIEFEIPRRARRPDAVLLADDVIFVIEFKVGALSSDIRN